MRLTLVCTIFPFTHFFFFFFFRISTEIVLKAARRQCRLHLNVLKAYFSESLSNVKQTLSSSKPLSAINVKTELGGSEKSYEGLFSEFLVQLVVNVVEKIKGILQDLMVSPTKCMFEIRVASYYLISVLFSGIFATRTDIFV